MALSILSFMGSSCYICIVIWCWFQLTQYYDYPHLLFWVFPPLLYGKRVKDLFGILAAKFWKPKKRTWIGVVNAHRAYYLTMEHRMIVFRDSKAENVVPQRQPPLLHLMELCEKDSNSEFPFPPYPESQQWMTTIQTRCGECRPVLVKWLLNWLQHLAA